MFQLKRCLTVPERFSYFLPAQRNPSDGLIAVKNVVDVASLATQDLSAAVDMGDGVVMDVGVNSLPSHFQNLLKAARSILRLRQSVIENHWEEADNVLDFIRQKNLLTVVPLIQNEFHAAVEAVDAELVLSICQNALASGCVIANSTEMSEFDVSKVTTEHLDKAIDICLAKGCRTKASTILFKAANIARDIRRAALANDWGTLKSVLQKIKQDKMSAEFPKCTVDEIATTQTVIANEDFNNQIMSALMKETINLHYGKLPEPKFITTTGLRIALKDAATLEGELRGRKLRILIDIAEHAVECREGLKTNAWRVVLSSSTGLLRAIDLMKEICAVDANRKTLDSKSARRGSVRRGSIGANSPHETSPKSTFIATMESEHCLLTDFISMHRLESEALQALALNGFTKECVGCVENAVISCTALADVLDQLSKLQETSALSLTDSLSEIAISVNMIKDIRSAISAGFWKKVRQLVNEATSREVFDQLPEVSKNEVIAVKSELENREMIENLSAALAIGRIEGEADQINIETITFQALEAAICECKSYEIKTEEGGCLMYSAMQILRLRQYILERPTPWGKLKVYASGLLTSQQQSKLHPSTIPEIRLIHAVVVDNVLCKSLSDALVTGNPTGPPGKMDCSEVSVRALESACHEAVLAVNRTEKSEQLLRFCKFFISLRELLMHFDIVDSDDKMRWDTWSSVSAIISNIMVIARKNPLDAGWLVCRNIVTSISKEVLIQECLSSLKESVRAACLTYSNLGKLSFGADDSMSRVSERIETRSLDQIIEHCTEYAESTSLYLDQLLSAVQSLKQLRVLVNGCEWVKVKKFTRNRDLNSVFLNCIFCMEEVQCAYQEAHNAEFMEAIEAVLRRPFKFSLSLSIEEVEEALLSENLLNDVNRRAESAGLTTVSAQQLLECSERLLHLRFAVRNYETFAVHKELRWFQSNGHICASQIMFEVGLLERLFKNAMAIKKIIDAVSTGFAVRQNGTLNTSHVNTEVITDALDEAKNIQDPTEDLQVMIHVGELIYGLRYAQKYQDEDAVKVAVDNIMSSHISLHSSAVEEVSEARAEVGNKAAVATLTNALKAFKPAGSMVPASGETSSILDETGSQDMSEFSPSYKNAPENKFKSPRSGTPRGGPRKQLMRQRSRNLESITVHPSSAQALEIALEEAEHHGIFSVEAKRLKKTTLFVLSLRYAIETDDWFRVEEILAEHDKKSATRRKSYIQLVDVASTEIQYVRLQLQVMSSLVLLGKNLKTGWASCSNGIVDVTRLLVEPLLVAITNTENSISEFDEMKVSPSEPQGEKYNLKHINDGKIEKESVKRLLQSAHEIYKIRKHLSAGEISAAASQAERALQSKPHAMVQAELQLYYVEIGRALHMMRLCRSLRGSMRLGNVEALEATIFEAQQASMQLSGDLGLVRTLEKALELYRSIIEAHSYLRSVAAGYDIRQIETALEQSIKLNMSGALVDKVKVRLGVLKKFEANVKALTASISATTNPVQVQELVSQLAAAGDLHGHPIARRAATLLRLSRDSLRTALLGEAVFSGNARLAACETLSVRRHYLGRKNLRAALQMSNFSGYRDPDNFATRMMLDAQELHVSMLHHCEGHIATSLTKLSPAFAALAVWMFRHCVRAIEEQEYSHPEVILRNIISLGRFSIPMRDEIIAQLIKQLTGNQEEGNRVRLWLVLLACLEHFPPSMEFETFVEFYLVTELENSSPQSESFDFASQCCTALHESIFKFGYSRRITTSWDASLKRMQSLLSPKFRQTEKSSEHSVQCTSIMQEALGLNNRRRSITTTYLRKQKSTESMLASEFLVSKPKNSLHSVSEEVSWDDGFALNAKLPKPVSAGKKTRRMSSIEPSSNNSSFNRGDSFSMSQNEERESPPMFSNFNGENRSGVLHRDSLSASFFEKKDVLPSKAVSDKKLRGTTENWKARFSMLSAGKKSVSFQAFLLNYKNNDLDIRDKNMFSFMIFGNVPKTKVIRTDADKYLIFDDENIDPEMSFSRQHIIARYCSSTEAARRDVTYDVAVLNFWNRFVAPFLDEEKDDHSQSEDDDGYVFEKEVEDNFTRPGEFDYVLYRDLVLAATDYLLHNKE